MNFNLKKHKTIHNLFISNNFIEITRLEEDACINALTYQKSPEFQSIIEEMTAKPEILNVISSDVRVVLDESFGVVKVRSLPKAMKHSDVEKALKFSVQVDIGQDINKSYLAFDVLNEFQNNKSYILVYSAKDDIIAIENLLKAHKLNIKSISHFIIDFINGLLSLGLDLPINAIYIDTNYYIILKLDNEFIGYKKIDILDVGNEKYGILDDIKYYASSSSLGLEHISLIYSKVFDNDTEFYNSLKSLIPIENEIRPPYDFDCYIKQVNKRL